MIYRFGACKLDTDRLELWRGSDPVTVEPQVFSLLLHLIENKDRVVSKDDLLASVWQGRIVSDATLSSRINAARRAVGDNGKEQAVIRTIARRGFRFIAELVEESESGHGREETASTTLPVERIGATGSIEYGTLSLPDKLSIAVLPFENMSADPEQEYFTDGITEDIITTLSKVPRLFVVSRNSTLVYKGSAVDVKQVAAEQGVRYVLEGSTRKVGNRVRITAQLIDASNGLNLWADHYDGGLDDVFALQDEITQEIVSALEVSLTEGEQARLWRRRAGDPRVYEHFLRGRALYNQFTRQTHAQAREEFEAAIRLNPGFPMAYVFLGYIYGDEVRWSWSSNPEQSIRMVYELSQKALELDPDLPEALVAMAYLHLLRREHDEAVPLAEKAVALGPSNAEVHHVAAMIFNYAGMAEQGMSVAKQAIRLSPMAYSNSLTELSHSHCLLGQCDEAIAILRRVLAETPFWRSARALLVVALHELGKVEEARLEANEILRAAPRFSLTRWAESHPYRRREDLDRYIGALRGSGLPE